MGSERDDPTEEIQLDEMDEATDPEIRMPPAEAKGRPSSGPPPLPAKAGGPPPLPGGAPSPVQTKEALAPTDPPPKSPVPTAGGPRKPPARLGRSVMPAPPPAGGSVPARPSAPPPVARTMKTTLKLKKVPPPAKVPTVTGAGAPGFEPTSRKLASSASKPAPSEPAPKAPGPSKPAPKAPAKAAKKPSSDKPTSAAGSLTKSTPTRPDKPRRSGLQVPSVPPSIRPARSLSSESMTMVALQARVRSLELDGKEQRAALEKVEELQESLARVVDRLTKRVDDLADAGGDKAAERIEAMEARVAETTRMQLELAQHDDRIEALEEAGADSPSAGADPSEALTALTERVAAVEAAPSAGDTTELERRLEAAEAGLVDARAQLKARDEEIAALLQRLEGLERHESNQASRPAAKTDPPEALDTTRESASALGGRSSEPESDSESALGARTSESDSASESASAANTPSGPPVALTDVKGIGPKLSKKLSAAGLEDARVLAVMDDAALDALAESSGIKRGRLDRLRSAAAAL